MNIELVITEISEENKKEKLKTATTVLAGMLGIPLELNGETLNSKKLLEKAYKYIRRWKKKGKWHYAYPHIKTDASGKQRVDKKHAIAASTVLIDYISPIEPTEDNIKKEFAKLRRLSKEGKLRVKAYGNVPVIINQMSEEHLHTTKRHNRPENIIDERASLLPFVPELLNNTGKLGEISRRKGAVTYGIVGRVKIGEKIKVIEISLAYDKQANLFFLSGYEIKKVGSLRAIMGKKSLGQYDPAIYRPTGNLKTIIRKESLNQFVPTSLEKDGVNNSHPTEITISKATQDVKLYVDSQSNSELLEKAKLHKYVKKEFKNGVWHYTYETDRKQAVGKLAVCTAKPLMATSDNAKTIGKQFIKQWRKDWQQHPEKRKCPALNYTKIGFGDISLKHLSIKGKNKKRNDKELLERVMILPFAKEILEGENKGIGAVVRVDENKQLVYYEIIGRAKIGGKERAISVIVSKFKPDAKKYISVIKKAVSNMLHRNSSNGVTGEGVAAIDDLHPSAILQKRIAHNGGEAINQSLFLSPCPNVPHPTETIIPQAAQNFKPYPTIILTIRDITDENRLFKFTKAVKAAAKQLRIPIGLKEIDAEKEKSLYPIQEEIRQDWIQYYQILLDKLYKAVTNTFTLPAVSIETVRKSVDTPVLHKSFFASKIRTFRDYIKGLFIKPLQYKGKIVYNPETGEPLLKKDFTAFIDAVEKFLNQNTDDIAKHITLDSIAISKILSRIAAYSTTTALHKMTTENLKYKGKTFDWIRQEYRNLSDALGKPLSRSEKARYQVCEDYATQLITRINDDARNGIKETLLDGIRNRKSKAAVSQALFDEFAGLNRNWKRIIETETVNTSNLAAILEDVQKANEGEKVYFIRHEMADACEQCQRIDGLIALWSSVPLDTDKIKDEYASVALWEGKESDGKKGVIGTGTLHPHCRGFWQRWAHDELNATQAIINGKEKEWNAAVEKVNAEYEQKGIKHPHDETAGYVRRIHAVYAEKK